MSYNHRDRAIAGWLHRALETYSIPKQLRGHDSQLGILGTRLPPVFRDREELAASADLAQTVREALEASASLVVICSPNAARSKWVNEEIRTFTALGRRAQIQCLIVDGMPDASRTPGLDPQLECLPPALFEGDGREPLASDIRRGGDGRAAARLKLLAGILGVPFDLLRQREHVRRNRRLLVASSLLGLGFIAMSGLAAAALIARNDAVQQRDIARRKTVTAERTVDFVKSLFEVSNPSEAKGEAITAREILDRGAARIEQGLTDEPSVKAELTTTLGEVYAGLGLFKQGEGIIRRNLALKDVDVGSRTRQFIALGEAQSRQGNYDAAVASYDAALRLAQDVRQPRPDLMPRIYVGLGDAESELGAHAKAEQWLRKALDVDLRRLGPSHPDVARELEVLGTNAVADGRLSDGRAHLERALAIRREAQGDLHPRVSADLVNLGGIAYLQRDPKSAEVYYRAALDAATKVLGRDHPDIALTQNNLGRLLIERRDYAGARPLLEHAVDVVSRERGETFNDLAFYFDNLAIIRRSTGDLPDAETLLRKGLVAAQVHKHRNLAPIMVDLADVRCALGAPKDGLMLLEEARPIMAKTYTKDPWRLAWLDTIRAECLLAAGERRSARDLLQSTAPVMAKRWPPDSHYGARSNELLTRASAR
ncbi:MAG: tetratricopeptide repeat protein [Phenylobacterium sp.]